MTSRDEFDVVMREWFESNALVGEPHGIHESAIRRARATRQRPRLMANPHGGYPVTRTGTVLRRRHLLAMAAALVGAALAWSLFSADPFQTGTDQQVRRPRRHRQRMPTGRSGSAFLLNS